jgi:mannosyltransferase OCH1-like enzyme
MIIHQIFINDTNKLPDEFPEFHNICYEQIKKLYPNEEYHLYSGEELEEIVKNYFDNDVYISYKKLKPYACKADLARLCLLYLYGGLYIDLNLYFINTIPNLDKMEFFAFRDKDANKYSNKNFRIQNGLIYSLSNSKILKNSIDLIVNNCLNNYYGNSPVDISGPTPLGVSIKQIKKEYYDITCGEFCFFDIRNLNQTLKYKLNQIGYNENIQIGYIMSDNNKLIAIRKPLINGSLNQGNMKNNGYNGTNNYVEMWKNRNIYDLKYKFKNKKPISINYQ